LAPTKFWVGSLITRLLTLPDYDKGLIISGKLQYALERIFKLSGKKKI